MSTLIGDRISVAKTLGLSWICFILPQGLVGIIEAARTDCADSVKVVLFLLLWLTLFLVSLYRFSNIDAIMGKDDPVALVMRDLKFGLLSPVIAC